MKRKIKTFFPWLLLFLAVFPLLAKKDYTVNSQERPGSDVITLQFNLNNHQFLEVEKQGGQFTEVTFHGGILSYDKGFPQILKVHSAVRLANNHNYRAEVTAADYIDYDYTAPYLPSRGVLYRNQNIQAIPYAIAAQSLRNVWYPAEDQRAMAKEPFLLRNTRGCLVEINPIAVNTQLKIVRVYTRLTIQLLPDRTPPINPLPQRDRRVKITRFDQELSDSLFVNNTSPRFDNDIPEDINGHVPEMLVIYTSRDAAAIQPYINWKREKGFKVHIQQVTTGTNVQTTIQNAYNANPNLLYVQLVGDWADIKGPTNSSSLPLDTKMGNVSGSDNYPDIIVGRFSGENTTHITTQVNKAIAYEKNPDVSGTWYRRALGIGGDDGPSDDESNDWGQVDAIKDNKLIPYGYTQVDEAYGDNTATSNVTTPVNNGLSLINYSNHGTYSYFPVGNITSTVANGLTNGSKLPVMTAVACDVGNYSKSCIAEYLMRNANGGLVGGWFATISQPWYPPYYGQDYFNDLLIGGYNYDTQPGDGISTNEGRTTFGALCFNAGILMYKEDNSSSSLETLQSWIVFGDASLQVRTKTPQSISISNSTVNVGLPFSTIVSSQSAGVKGAMVSISQGENVFSAFTNASGSVSITHSLSQGTAKLVVSGFNLTTIYQDITIGNSDLPVADFNYTINIYTVAFTDLSSDANGSIIAWNWAFGDNSSSTIKNPTHTFAYAGTYPVKLTVTNNNNKSNSITKTIIITEPTPIEAKIGIPDPPNGKTICFRDESISSGIILSRLWEFGDGNTSTLENPCHTYADWGIYVVKLTVTDNLPSTDTVTYNLVLEDVPPSIPCASAGTDYSYFWFSKVELGTLSNTSAGNGYFDYSKTVAAPELKKGSSYTLTMTINTAQYTNWFKAYIDYNRDGDFEDAGEVIYVIPSAQKVATAGGTIAIPSTAVKGLTWMRVQVKNSTSSNLPAPEPCETIAYGEVEDYYVNITDDCQPPVAGFNFSVNKCVATFTTTSTSATPIVSYSWNFGNSTGSTLANPSCTYAANGNYNASLTVTNSCGKSAAITKAVAITDCGGCDYDHLVGSFPNIGIWLRDSQTAAWTQLSKQQADVIRLGDVNGNGLDDMAALFNSTGKLWYRYDSGVWEDIAASAATLTAFDLGDMNNDSRQDLVGSWSDKGLWWRNNANGVWTKLSNLTCTHVAAGDFNGDSKADVVGLFPSLNSIWIYYSNNTWKQISKQINLADLRVGNMDSDAKAELVGSWDIGVWVFDPETNHWEKHHAAQAKQVAVGDINAQCMKDIVGYWDAATPLYVKYMENNTWVKLSTYNPDTMDAGRVK